MTISYTIKNGKKKEECRIPSQTKRNFPACVFEVLLKF